MGSAAFLNKNVHLEQWRRHRNTAVFLQQSLKTKTSPTAPSGCERCKRKLKYFNLFACRLSSVGLFIASHKPSQSVFPHLSEHIAKFSTTPPPPRWRSAVPLKPQQICASQQPARPSLGGNGQHFVGTQDLDPVAIRVLNEGQAFHFTWGDKESQCQAAAALRAAPRFLTVVGLLHKRDSLRLEKVTGHMDVGNCDSNVSCQTWTEFAWQSHLTPCCKCFASSLQIRQQTLTISGDMRAEIKPRHYNSGMNNRKPLYDLKTTP